MLGRAREREALDRLLDGVVEERRGGVLVVHGEPGVGKTALLEYTVAAARRFRIARTSGVEAEMELPFAAVQQLCSPFFELRERLPDPQQHGLDVAFGLSTGPAPNPFLVGLGILGLLAEAAEEQPLVCLVDDGQWLDSASARTLAFVARRLLAEKIALVFATRDLGEALAGLPDLQVGPLSRRDARALLESVLPARLDESVEERIVAETRGNPLALLELPRGLSPTQLAGGFGLPTTAPLSAGIEDRYTRRLAKLPSDARRLLLVAAADPVGDPSLVWRAAEPLGIPESAAHTVESEHLLALSPRVVFRHPLVRSAVYGSADLTERREVHRALADVTDPEVDPDRRAWHRAQAAAGPDEEVALELERSAGRAQRRGGLAAAAAFLERAMALTGDAARRTQRAFVAAQAAHEAGACDTASALLATAEGASLDELQRARAERLRAQIELTRRRGSAAPTLLLQAAQRLEALDGALARETYLEALEAALITGHREAIDEAVQALCRDGVDEARPAELLVIGLGLLSSDDRVAGTSILKRALEAFRSGSLPGTDEPRALSFASATAMRLLGGRSLARALGAQRSVRARHGRAHAAADRHPPACRRADLQRTVRRCAGDHRRV